MLWPRFPLIFCQKLLIILHHNITKQARTTTRSVDKNRRERNGFAHVLFICFNRAGVR